MKELKVRPGTDVHDYEVRLRAAQKFLAKVSSSTWQQQKSGVLFLICNIQFCIKNLQMQAYFSSDTDCAGVGTANVNMPKLATRQAAAGTYPTYTD